MSTKPAPARLFIIFAKEAHEAVIFRRGPAAWYHIIRWNTKDDRFERGAWIKGKIYPEKCDLSPDGELLLYFAHQGSRISTDYSHAWTAISRSPWLTALGLWPQGTTYGGGGRFTGNRSAILQAYQPAHANHPGEGLSVTFGQTPEYVSSTEVPEAEWSGRDQNGRLVYTSKGLLLHRKAKGEDVCLADFNGYSPDPQPAPKSAEEPLKAHKQKRATTDSKSKKIGKRG